MGPETNLGLRSTTCTAAMTVVTCLGQDRIMDSIPIQVGCPLQDKKAQSALLFAQ